MQSLVHCLCETHQTIVHIAQRRMACPLPHPTRPDCANARHEAFRKISPYNVSARCRFGVSCDDFNSPEASSSMANANAMLNSVVELATVELAAAKFVADGLDVSGGLFYGECVIMLNHGYRWLLSESSAISKINVKQRKQKTGDTNANLAAQS